MCNFVATLLSGECEDETHTHRMRTWESADTSEISKFNCRGQNTSHCGVLYIIGNLLKRRCQKWARMSHLDICSTSYGKKKVGSQTVALHLHAPGLGRFPSRSFSTPLLPPPPPSLVLWVKERVPIPPLSIVSTWDSYFGSIKELGSRQIYYFHVHSILVYNISCSDT
jgi:hypothetical protein